MATMRPETGGEEETKGENKELPSTFHVITGTLHFHGLLSNDQMHVWKPNAKEVPAKSHRTRGYRIKRLFVGLMVKKKKELKF